MDPLELSYTAPKFAAPDPKALAKWYHQQLGFKPISVFEGGNYAITSRGELTLHFWKCSDPHIAENTACYVEIETAAALNQLHAEFIKRSKSNGFEPGRVQAEPENAAHGMREFHLWDPAGNLIGFGAQL